MKNVIFEGEVGYFISDIPIPYDLEKGTILYIPRICHGVSSKPKNGLVKICKILNNNSSYNIQVNRLYDRITKNGIILISSSKKYVWSHSFICHIDNRIVFIMDMRL